MEVAREKPLPPTIFDVAAVRSLPEAAKGTSFRDCLVSPSFRSASSAEGASSSTTSRPPEPPAARDAKPAHDDRRPDQEHAEGITPTESQSNAASPEEKVTAKVADESPESTQASKTTADAPAEPSSDGDETSEQATEAAEVMAAAQAAVQGTEQQLPDEVKQENGAEASLPVAEGEAKVSDETANATGKSQAKSSTSEADQMVEPKTPPATVTTAEVVPARVVESDKSGEGGEEVATVQGAVETVASAEVALPEAETTAVGDTPAPASVPAVVQASEQGQRGDSWQEGTPGGERSAKLSKKGAPKGEVVDAEQATTETTPTVTNAAPRAVVAEDAERSEEEPKPEIAEARGAEAIANKPTASPVAADSVIPIEGPPGPEAAAPSAAGDLAASTEPNTATTGTNPPASAISTAAPRVPPALLRKVDSSGATHVRPGEIDPARFLSRVVKAFESAQQRDTEVRLRLHPSELGSLSIEVRVQDSALTARLQAETPEARTALLDNLPMLRERLADQGIRIEKFDVDLMDHSDRQPQQSPSEQMPEDSGRRSTQSRLPTTTAKALEKDNKTTTVRGGNATDRLNVVI